MYNLISSRADHITHAFYHVRSLSRLIFVVAYLSTLGTLVEAQPGQDIPILEPGKPIQHELDGGQSQSYRIRLEAGQFVQIVVDQHGIDVLLVLISDRKAIVERDRPTECGERSHSHSSPQTDENIRLTLEPRIKRQRQEFTKSRVLLRELPR